MMRVLVNLQNNALNFLAPDEHYKYLGFGRLLRVISLLKSSMFWTKCDNALLL